VAFAVGCAAGPPSGSWPTIAGSGTTASNSTGSATATTSAPRIGAAVASPCDSMSAVPTGTSTAPPRDTPVDEIDVAFARDRMNQRDNIAEIGTPAPTP
jgi:hypothetical protein